MDEEPEQPKPNDLLITSETKRIALYSRPPGGGWLVLRLTITECHTWRGIGGRTGRVRHPRRLTSEIPLDLDDDNSRCCCCGGPDFQRRGGGNWRRRLIVAAIKNSLGEEKVYRCLSQAEWDKAVPLRLERDIADAKHHVDGTCQARVDIEVSFEFIYSEPDELLRACDENDGGGPAGRSGDGEAPPSCCSICFEEMSREAGLVTDLPGCRHGFHFWCIDAWFHKASTCPVCRRDQLQYLPPGYRDLHDKMAIDPDGLMPEY